MELHQWQTSSVLHDRVVIVVRSSVGTKLDLKARLSRAGQAFFFLFISQNALCYLRLANIFLVMKVSGVCGRDHRAVLGSLGPGHQCVCLMAIIINKILGFDNHRSFFFFLRASLRLLKCKQKKESPFIICELFVGDSDSSERHPGKTTYCPW